MRFLADIPDDDVQWLDQRAREQGKSRAAVLREAVRDHRANAESMTSKKWLDIGFGAWKDIVDIGDAVEWQRRERASTTRPWDDDYEDTRAEFPDLFDAEDDRQRQIYLDMVAGKYPDAKTPVSR
ncbi:ribbon-helix-helix protein, CopG family [Sphingobium sp. Z007]|uniref:ribbon-helix-helix protein, CopG family n=1 Tax=Sphingobium sp. Z007 TaxID=627495 RepID=UPI000B4A23E6|nr:ribbon-helix-helix protein, CopG family [Sphingobium sp. Z007]